MATTNSLNIVSAGIVKYDGLGVFTANSTTNHAILIGAASNGITSLTLTNGQLPIGSTGADPVAANITAGTGIGVTNGAGSITLSVTGGGVTWSSITANQALAVNNGYFVTSGALSLSLPATSAVGDQIYVALRGGTSWTITQGAGQSIIIGSNTTSTGAGGSLASTAAGDCVRIVCHTANTGWQTISSMGNITFV